MKGSRIMAGRPSGFPVWAAGLLLVLTFVGWDSAVRTRHIRQVTNSYGVTVDAPHRDNTRASGYADGRRALILPDRSMDGYHWIMQTQEMLARGDWRERHVDYDHPPKGREVHWAQPFRWWLVLLAGVHHFWTGEPMAIALEQSSLLSGPLLLGIVLIGVTLLLARRFAPSAALLFAPALVAAYPLYVDFVAGYVDHHGLVNSCALLSVLFLLAHRGDKRGARHWVIASAVAAGVGLWISAATQIIVLAAIGIGGVAACRLGRGPGTTSVWLKHPQLFRLWGQVGAGVSLVAYGMEYFPHEAGLRLEVNHPLFALAWLAGGECLCRIARLNQETENPNRPHDRIAAAIAAGIIALTPAVIFLTKQNNFLVADPFLWRLHRDFIAEFQSLPGFLGENHYSWKSLGYCLPLLALVPVMVRVLKKSDEPGIRAQLALALLPALFVLPFAWNQIRWWSLAYALLFPALAVFFRTLHEDKTKGSKTTAIWMLLTGLLFLPAAIATVQHTATSSELTADDIRDLAAREVAHWLRQRAGHGEVVVAASPTITTSLIFQGGLTGVGTLYWENRDGLKSAAELYAAPDEAAAKAVVQACGITHIVIVTWDGFEGVYVRLARGLPATASLPADAFIVRLLTAPVPPPWLRALTFPLPAHSALDGQQIRVYEVTPGQSPEMALIHAADFYLESDKVADAQHLAAAFASHDGSLAVNTVLAEIAWRKKDEAALNPCIAKVREQLKAAESLPFEEHVRLVEVLLATGEPDLIRDQLNGCVHKATEENLRRLAARKLSVLLKLSHAAGVEWPSPALRQLAVTLLPPALRRDSAPSAGRSDGQSGAVSARP